MRLSQLPTMREAPASAPAARCAPCRFHDDRLGRCTYTGACPHPACEWCQLRPATIRRPLPDHTWIDLCDDCFQ